MCARPDGGVDRPQLDPARSVQHADAAASGAPRGTKPARLCSPGRRGGRCYAAPSCNLGQDAFSTKLVSVEALQFVLKVWETTSGAVTEVRCRIFVSRPG